MNDNQISLILQQGFRIAVGAVTSLVETAQNPDKRSEMISQMQMELSQKTREWAVKGETTEQEAKRMLDALMARYQNQSDRSEDVSPAAVTDTDVRSGLQELTEEIIALRIELAKMDAEPK